MTEEVRSLLPHGQQIHWTIKSNYSDMWSHECLPLHFSSAAEQRVFKNGTTQPRSERRVLKRKESNCCCKRCVGCEQKCSRNPLNKNNIFALYKSDWRNCYCLSEYGVGCYLVVIFCFLRTKKWKSKEKRKSKKLCKKSVRCGSSECGESVNSMRRSNYSLQTRKIY